MVIQPNSPKALRLDEMGYTDVGDRLEDMKVRAEYRAFNFPFLYDGETQEVSRQVRAGATPHVFVFDAARTLRYQGRVDSNPREAYAKVPDARNAIDAVLAGTPRRSRRRRRWAARSSGWTRRRSTTPRRRPSRRSRCRSRRSTPEGVKALRQNTGGKTRLVNFWATWCAPCTAEFPDLQATFRMYRKRPFELVTVSINYPDEEKGVRRSSTAARVVAQTTLRPRWIRTR